MVSLGNGKDRASNLITFQSNAVWTTLADVDRCARALADPARWGGVILLEGALGAGKTTMIQALCRHLGYQGEVLSPTFDLLHRYEMSTLTIYHVDGYRLEQREQWDVLDLPPWDAPSTLILAEWGSALREFYPERLEMTIRIGQNAARYVNICAWGDEWARRLTHKGEVQHGI